MILTWPSAWNRIEEAANTKECSFKEEPSSRWMTTSRRVFKSFSGLFCSDNWRHLSFSTRASDSMLGWRVHRRQYWKSWTFWRYSSIKCEMEKRHTVWTYFTDGNQFSYRVIIVVVVDNGLRGEDLPETVHLRPSQCLQPAIKLSSPTAESRVLVLSHLLLSLVRLESPLDLVQP